MDFYGIYSSYSLHVYFLLLNRLVNNLEEMSSYGENLLKKYGWNEGQGVGKNNQGIVNPIKASLKFDTAGVSFSQIDLFFEYLIKLNAS